MASGRGVAGQGTRILICALLSLALPGWYYWRLYARLRGLDTLEMNVHPEAPHFISQERWREAWRLMFRSELIGELITTFTLSILTCVLVRWRMVRGQSAGGAARALSDVGLLAGFVLAPWLAVGIGSFSPPDGNLVDQWVMGDLWRNVMPSVAAMLAGLLFFLTRRQYGHVSTAA